MKRLHKIDSQQQAISDNMESVRANRAQDMVHSTVSSMLDHEDAQDRKAMTSAAVGRIKAELAGAPESAATHRGLRFASRSQARLQDKKEKMLSPEVDSDCGEEIGEGSGSGSLEDKVQEAVDDAVGHTDEDLGTSQEMEDTAEEANAVKKEEEEAEQQIEEAEQAAGACLPTSSLWDWPPLLPPFAPLALELTASLLRCGPAQAL